MKKFNFIIGKRQIMVSTLLLILAIAAYLNWLAAGDQAITVMDVIHPKKTEISSQNNDAETDSANTYGATELVSGQSTNDYFNQAKLQKTASHAETSDELNRLISAPETPAGLRCKARTARPDSPSPRTSRRYCTARRLHRRSSILLRQTA